MFKHSNIKIISVILAVGTHLLIFTGCTANKNTREYHELIKSYTRDKDYKKGTDAIKKNVASSKTQNPVTVFANTIHTKIGPVIANAGKFKGIPILMYHCIDSTVWGDKPMFVSTDNFDTQMKYLKDQHYCAITFQDLNRLDSIKNPVMITFDDGYEDNFTNAYPILKRYGLKATIFLIVNTIDRPNFLKMDEIKRMADIIDFESHTMSHPHLANLDSAKIDYELSESKKELEEKLGKKIDVLAYPYGSYSNTVIDIARKYYTFAVTTNYGKFVDTPSNEYTIKRMYVVNQMDLNKFIRLFK